MRMLRQRELATADPRDPDLLFGCAFDWCTRQVFRFRKRVWLYPCCLCLAAGPRAEAGEGHIVGGTDLTNSIKDRHIADGSCLKRLFYQIRRENPWTLQTHDVLPRVQKGHYSASPPTYPPQGATPGFTYVDMCRTTRVLLPQSKDPGIYSQTAGQARLHLFR